MLAGVREGYAQEEGAEALGPGAKNFTLTLAVGCVVGSRPHLIGRLVDFTMIPF